MQIHEQTEVSAVVGQMRDFFCRDGKGGTKYIKVIEADRTPGKHWSLEHDCCVVCGTTKRKHMGGGKCSRCYFTGNRKDKHTHCQYLHCPWDRTDYRTEDMIERNGRWYCSEECYKQEVEAYGQ